MSMGGGGGGGSSGAVSWPTYFQDWHGAWLGPPGTTTPESTLATILNAALGNSPFTGETTYDPNTDLSALLNVLNGLVTVSSTLDPVTVWATYIAAVKSYFDTNVFSVSAIAAKEAAYNASVDADVTNVVLPRFQRGMQDANAVMSSAFVIGEALIEAEATRKKATFSADLRLQEYQQEINALIQGTEGLARFAAQIWEFRRSTAVAYAEGTRIKIVAKKEETDGNLKIAEMDAKWDLEVFTYGGNFLAAGHGGVQQSGTKANPVQSVLGGAISGAAMGGSVAAAYGALTAGSMAAGPIGWGIGIGAVLGGALGFFG